MSDRCLKCPFCDKPCGNDWCSYTKPTTIEAMIDYLTSSLNVSESQLAALLGMSESLLVAFKDSHPDNGGKVRRIINLQRVVIELLKNGTGEWSMLGILNETYEGAGRSLLDLITLDAGDSTIDFVTYLFIRYINTDKVILNALSVSNKG